MKRIVFDEPLSNDEMGAVISALIMRKQQLREFINIVEDDILYLAYNKEFEFIKSVLDKIHVEG